jgi:hypothetical protein
MGPIGCPKTPSNSPEKSSSGMQPTQRTYDMVSLCFMLYSLRFTGVCSLNTNVSEHSVCSIFIVEYVWTSAKPHTPANHTEESIQQSEHGESLKSRKSPYSLCIRTFLFTAVCVFGTKKKITGNWYAIACVIQGYYKRNRHFQCCIETKLLDFAKILTWFYSTCFYVYMTKLQIFYVWAFFVTRQI